MDTHSGQSLATSSIVTVITAKSNKTVTSGIAPLVLRCQTQPRYRTVNRDQTEVDTTDSDG